MFKYESCHVQIHLEDSAIVACVRNEQEATRDSMKASSDCSRNRCLILNTTQRQRNDEMMIPQVQALSSASHLLWSGHRGGDNLDVSRCSP